MKLKKLFSVLFIFAIVTTGALAQVPQQMPQQQSTEVSDNEIEKFATAFREVQVIDQQVQQDMTTAVQEEGVDIQRFNEYIAAQQTPGQEMQASEEEMEQFAEAYQQIEEIQMEAQKEMEEVITENDLTIPRYQEIAMAIQANPELMQKLQQQMEPQGE